MISKRLSAHEGRGLERAHPLPLAYLIVSELGWDKNSDTVNATKLSDKPSSEHVYGDAPLIRNPQM